MSGLGYTFLPWARRGASALATSSPATNYLTLSVQATVNATAAPAVGVRLFGPGDVTGIDPRIISRREPLPDTSTFEPNYMAAIEFAAPDFPWLFSPEVPAGSMLQPWICLVVVRVQPGVSLVTRAQNLPLLQFEAPAAPLDELPNLAEIAAWAHVQQTGADGIDQGISRIICPRKLQASTAYLACLVPAYHAGVSAGVSPDLPRTDGDVAPAWDANVVAPFALPVYAAWQFATSEGGDFASLVRRLRTPATPLELGTRDLDASAPGFGLPAFAGLTLGLQGALVSTSSAATAWPAGVETNFVAALREILVPAADVPIVAPPTYGSVAAGAPLPADNANPAWLRELNLDPRWRAVAGVAGSIVANAREALVGSAWDQFEAVRNANQLLHQLQLGREASAAAHARHLAHLSAADAFLQIVRPVLTRLRVGGAAQTLYGQMTQSRVPIGAVSAAFRRLTRRRGPLGRALLAAGAPALRVVDRLNAASGTTGALAVAPQRVPPNGTVLLDAITPAISTTQLAPNVVSAAAGWFATSTAVATTTTPQPVVNDVHVDLAKVGPGPGTNASVLPVIVAKGLSEPPPLAIDVNAQLEMVMRFRFAASTIATYITSKTTQISDAPPLPPLAVDLDDVRTLALAAIDPVATFVARATARIPVPLATSGDPLQPLLVAPSFPQAMSRELAPSQLLPGVERIVPDTVVLLETNAPFVEAFMVGLNDALRRELAWRGFPCDQRGTFFAQFWSDGGNAPPDIAPIATWSAANALGANATTGPAQTVLLVRGELLRRYPNAVISAVQAVQTGNVRMLGTTELFPTFMGSIAPDIAFFGFALTPSSATSGAGWYFVLAEHPAEPRFGFEPVALTTPPTTWNDVAWTQLALNHNHIALAASTPGGALEGVAWNSGSAAQAFIGYRRPVRVALHANAILA